MAFDIIEFKPLLAFALFVLTYGVMFACARHQLSISPLREAATPLGASRYGCLDGLRGVLSIGVLVHHAFTARSYFLTGTWSWSESPVLNHLGQTSVALFFMITGFLFALKAMNGSINWPSFFANRVARLAPLHTIVVVAVFVLALLASGGIRESGFALARELAAWLIFALLGRPDFNGFPNTWVIVAGVTWSLKYEVIFYAVGVPALWWFFRRLRLSSAIIVLLTLWIFILGARKLYFGEAPGAILWAAHFMGGILTACAYRAGVLAAPLVARWLPWFGATAPLLILSYVDSYGAVQVIATTVVFAAVVGGASLFGLLRSRSAGWLGDISYGVYLIHGLVLWIFLAGMARYDLLRQLDLLSYSVAVLLISMLVSWISGLSYVYVERPSLKLLSRPQFGVARSVPVA